MKIAINCAFFQPKGGGIREYIYNLVNNIALVDHENDYILYVLSDMVDYAKNNLPDRFKVKVIPYTSKQVIKRSLFENYFWRNEEMIENFDIFHSPFFHLPKLKNAKTVITVHDLRFCKFPETYTLKRLIFLKLAVSRSVKRVDRIISISNFTKQELIRYYSLPCQKINVIYEAINLSDFSSDMIDYHNLDNDIIIKLKNKKFLFTVGHVEPRKNYIRLVQAFEKLNSECSDCLYLVIAGKKAQDYKRLSEIIQFRDDIIYLDFVSRDMLLWLYMNASAFIFPSIYEGFGFPPLEAAALGTVSAVSNSSCIPEICNNSVLYFNPYNVDDIKSICEKIIYDLDLRERLKINSKKNLLRFSWLENARSTIAVYNEIYNSNKL